MPDLVRAAKALERMAILLEIKSIASVSRNFRNDLYDIVNEALDSGGSIIRDMRPLVKQAVEDSYFEALKESDIEPDEMTKDDAENIVQLNETQQDYISDFSKAVREAAKDGTAESKNAILERVDMWTAGVCDNAYQAALASVKADEMVTWHLGSTEEHCTTCKRLDGQKHRRSWFADKGYTPGIPGSATECGGYSCDCSFEK